MPGRDGTGPWGQGPKTGRMAGYCAADEMLKYDSSTWGPDFRIGFGRGRGFGSAWACGRRFMSRVGRRFDWMPRGRNDITAFSEPSQEAEKRFLQTQAEALRSRLDEIKNRLDDLTGADA